MSVDNTRPDDPRHSLNADYAELTWPAPVEHGGGGQFLLDDVANSAVDTSLYDRLRKLWYDVVDSPEDEPVHVGTIQQEDGQDDLAVLFRSSKWRAGEGTGDDYKPFFKYHLTLRPIGPTGEIEHGRTPLRACSLTIMPYLKGLVQPDGEPLRLQYGTGTMIHVNSTWVADHGQLVDRSADVLDAALDEYRFDRELIVEESQRGWKVEDHHRFDERYIEDVVETLRRSEDLIALENGELSALDGERGKHGWSEYKFSTSRFDLLGVKDAADVLPPKAEILLKCYLPDHPERLEHPMDQPKLEAALITKQGERKPHFDEIPVIHHVLKSVVLSHFIWAGVPTDAILADEVSLGPDAEPYEWEHPQNRREQLQQWYKSKIPDLYAEATRTYRDRPGLTYDILQILVETAGATYDELVERTGARYSTVQRQARRLEDLGLCERLSGQQTLLTWSAPTMGEHAADVLEDVNSGDTPADRRERADERREELEEWHDAHEADEDETGEPDESNESRREQRRFAGLDELSQITVEHLPPLVDADRLGLDEIRIHVDADPAIS
ncbi:winged helix-turn-helix domain-containing protein [Haladaptatus sp. AB618]|uniref:winged helix-turn-helix domain-containing protein n=1 Tax=Haladaptatus sp. AB618 TaxID=2934173 RepID=UPI00209BDBD3|nr:winged helix-turn-helix transcriptional regulator [Haladaptatus sp. AB618]MCO8254557.1 winged helix-turn-helix domain-containing protein [Haladaptatus sp. AB618]